MIPRVVIHFSNTPQDEYGSWWNRLWNQITGHPLWVVIWTESRIGVEFYHNIRNNPVKGIHIGWLNTLMPPMVSQRWFTDKWLMILICKSLQQYCQSQKKVTKGWVTVLREMSVTSSLGESLCISCYCKNIAAYKYCLTLLWLKRPSKVQLCAIFLLKGVSLYKRCQ